MNDIIAPRCWACSLPPIYGGGYLCPDCAAYAGRQITLAPADAAQTSQATPQADTPTVTKPAETTSAGAGGFDPQLARRLASNDHDRAACAVCAANAPDEHETTRTLASDLRAAIWRRQSGATTAEAYGVELLRISNALATESVRARRDATTDGGTAK